MLYYKCRRSEKPKSSAQQKPGRLKDLDLGRKKPGRGNDYCRESVNILGNRKKVTPAGNFSSFARADDEHHRVAMLFAKPGRYGERKNIRASFEAYFFAPCGKWTPGLTTR